MAGLLACPLPTAAADAPQAVPAARAGVPSPSSLQSWQWLDGQGRRVFSDRPPPADVPPQRILRRLGTGEGISASSGGSPTDPIPEATPRQRGASAARPPQVSASQQVEEERMARLRADNCQRARSALATLESGVRLVRTNDKGEREILDDAARESEKKHLQQIVASNCTPR